jgi:hypothetical protein
LPNGIKGTSQLGKVLPDHTEDERAENFTACTWVEWARQFELYFQTIGTMNVDEFASRSNELAKIGEGNSD